MPSHRPSAHVVLGLERLLSDRLDVLKGARGFLSGVKTILSAAGKRIAAISFKALSRMAPKIIVIG